MLNQLETHIIKDVEVIPLNFFSFASFDWEPLEYYYNCSNRRNTQRFPSMLIYKSVSNLISADRMKKICGQNNEGIVNKIKKMIPQAQNISSINIALLIMNIFCFFILITAVIFVFCIYIDGESSQP